MVKIRAQLRVNEEGIIEGTEVASGWVEIEDCIKFPVTVRRYIDKETAKERMFVSYPQRKTEKGYEYVMYPDDPQVKKEIDAYVLESVKEAIVKSVNQIPVTETRVTVIKPKSDSSVKLCGIASIKLAGITINGIMIKEGENGLFVQMPQQKTSTGWKDIVYGTNPFMQYNIKDAVLEGYKKELEQKKQSKAGVEPKPQTAAALKI